MHQTPRWWRPGLGEGCVDFGGEEVLSLVTPGDSTSRGAGLRPEGVHSAARHQMPERTAQLGQLDRVRFVGDLLEVEDQVAVVIFLGLGDTWCDGRPDLT